MVKRSQIAKMGFLRERKIESNGQTYTYWYWCKRIRSRKKSGGNGKVKSVELCLGRYLYGKRFAYHCYTGDINIKAFLNEYVRHQIQALRFNIISDEEQQKIRDCMRFHIDSRHSTPKLALRAPQGFDLRLQRNRRWVKQIRYSVTDLWEHSQSIDRTVTRLAYLFWRYDQSKEQYSQYQAALKDYRANPNRVWTEMEDVRNPRTGDYEQREITYQWIDNAELIIEENISHHDRVMQWALEQHENLLKTMAQYAPKRDRTLFRQRLIREAEFRKSDKKLICQWELA